MYRKELLTILFSLMIAITSISSGYYLSSNNEIIEEESFTNLFFMEVEQLIAIEPITDKEFLILVQYIPEINVQNTTLSLIKINISGERLWSNNFSYFGYSDAFYTFFKFELDQYSGSVYFFISDHNINNNLLVTISRYHASVITQFTGSYDSFHKSEKYELLFVHELEYIESIPYLRYKLIVLQDNLFHSIIDITSFKLPFSHRTEETDDVILKYFNECDDWEAKTGCSYRLIITNKETLEIEVLIIDEHDYEQSVDFEFDIEDYLKNADIMRLHNDTAICYCTVIPTIMSPEHLIELKVMNITKDGYEILDSIIVDSIGLFYEYNLFSNVPSHHNYDFHQISSNTAIIPVRQTKITEYRDNETMFHDNVLALRLGYSNEGLKFNFISMGNNTIFDYYSHVINSKIIKLSDTDFMFIRFAKLQSLYEVYEFYLYRYIVKDQYHEFLVNGLLFIVPAMILVYSAFLIKKILAFRKIDNSQKHLYPKTDN
jgi:hypothetical protein